MPRSDRATPYGLWRPTRAVRLRRRRVGEAEVTLQRNSDGSADARPEILFVALANGLGGSMRSLATVLEHLDDFTRVVACPNSPFVRLIQERGCVDRWLELPPPHGNRLLKRLQAAVMVAGYAARNRRRLVAVHANGLSERTVVAIGAAISRRPVVVWAHEWKLSPWSSRLNRILTMLNPRTTFVGVSEVSREVLVAAGLAPRRRIAVIPNPIDPDQLGQAGQRIRRSGRPLTVGYLGTPARYKGFHLLPQLIQATETADVHWVVYSGPRTMMAEVWAELESLPPGRVTLRGKTPDIGEAYASCDIVCCPSYEESFGRVAAEAMAGGVPVVASDLPALREVVGLDGGGILVPPGDVEAMAGAIRLLSEDAGLRERLAAAGRVRAERYEPKRIAEQMSSLYRRAARPGG